MTATELNDAVLVKSNDRIGVSDDMKHILDSHFNQDALDESIKISTMSITFRITDQQIDLSHIAKECPLKEDGVQFTIYHHEYRSATGAVSERKKTKHSNFFNSMTMGISGDESDRPIHFKLFRNGSVQCAGCKSGRSGNTAIRHLIEAMSLFFVPNISNLKINLINANFKLGFNVNRDKLHKLFVNLGYLSTYEKCKHAGVSVKFKPTQKETPISLFVFESGSVVITGSKNEQHIVEGFHFMQDFAFEHRSAIHQYKNSVECAMANPKYAALMMV